MEDKRTPITRLTAFFKAFPDEKACEDYLFDVMYPNGFVCSRCGNKKHGRIKDRRELQCTKCSHQISLTKGTMMHGSHLPLSKWFLAIFLITHDKRGFSAMRLDHELKVAKATATYILRRIRATMTLQDIPVVLSGLVELDDAYIGSKGKTRGRGTEKTSFIVAVEKSKGGGAAMRATTSLNGEDYKEFARYHICRTSQIKADALPALMAGLSTYGGLDAHTFDATSEERSLPTVHNIISNYKAMVLGTYHGVSKKFMQGYMDEFTYRYNNRRNRDVFHTLLTDICLSIKQSKAKILELFAYQDTSISKIAA